MAEDEDCEVDGAEADDISGEDLEIGVPTQEDACGAHQAREQASAEEPPGYMGCLSPYTHCDEGGDDSGGAGGVGRDLPPEVDDSADGGGHGGAEEGAPHPLRGTLHTQEDYRTAQAEDCDDVWRQALAAAVEADVADNAEGAEHGD